MNAYLKNTSIIAALLFHNLLGWSQIGIGGGLNHTKYMGNFAKASPGFHTKIFFNSSEAFVITFGFIHSAPLKYNFTETVQARYTSTTPQTIRVNIAESYRFNTFYFRSDIFFIKDNEENFGFYIPAGISYVAAKATTQISEYDKVRYEEQYEGISNFGGFVMNAGLGGQIKINHTAVYIESAIGIPATTILGAEVQTYIPFHLSTNFGIKYHFLEY